jgi:hypothetical protein
MVEGEAETGTRDPCWTRETASCGFVFLGFETFHTKGFSVFGLRIQSG